MQTAYRIILADDHAMFRQGIKRIVEEIAGWQVVAETGDGVALLKLLNKTAADMVILDMIMPGISGGEVYNQLKAINPDIKVLLSSGYSIDGQAAKILERGCDGFLQKPFNIKDLSQKVREILDKE